MNADEIREFEKLKYVNSIIKVRIYDDAGKKKDAVIAPFSCFKPLLNRCVIDRALSDQ